jgi:hypothetical protein
MTTLDEIRTERERRERVALERAAKLPAGDYYASGNWLYTRNGGRVVECETHSDAVMVMMAAPKA